MCYKIEVQNRNAEKLNRKLDELNAPQFLRDYLNELESKSGALNYLVAIKDFLQWLIENNIINKKSISGIEVPDFSDLRPQNISSYLRYKETNGMSPTTTETRKNIIKSFIKNVYSYRECLLRELYNSMEDFSKQIKYKGISSKNNLTQKLPTENQLNDMEEKYTKVISVGDEAINYLENIKQDLENNTSFENIKVTKDVDKEFVRGLLDGIEVLYMLYDSSDKDVVNILKAISFMAQERRVLCIGLDICLKENKEDIGVDKEFKLNKYNLETTMDMINLISEAMDEETLIYVDLSDLKEIFQSKGAVSYSVKEFELDKNHAELAKMLEEDFYKSEGELTLKKGLLLAECSEAAGDNTLIYLNEVINALKDITESNIDMVFSYNEKAKDQKTMKIAYLRN